MKLTTHTSLLQRLFSVMLEIALRPVSQRCPFPFSVDLKVLKIIVDAAFE